MRYREFREMLGERGIKMHFFMGRILLEGKHKHIYKTEIMLNNKLDSPRNDALREPPDISEGVSDILDEEALEFYREEIAQHTKFEARLISDWAEENTPSGRAVKYAIEERIAIQEAEGLQSDKRTAILSVFAE